MYSTRVSIVHSRRSMDTHESSPADFVDVEDGVACIVRDEGLFGRLVACAVRHSCRTLNDQNRIADSAIRFELALYYISCFPTLEHVCLANRSEGKKELSICISLHISNLLEHAESPMNVLGLLALAALTWWTVLWLICLLGWSIACACFLHERGRSDMRKAIPARSATQIWLLHLLTIHGRLLLPLCKKLPASAYSDH